MEIINEWSSQLIVEPTDIRFSGHEARLSLFSTPDEGGDQPDRISADVGYTVVIDFIRIGERPRGILLESTLKQSELPSEWFLNHVISIELFLKNLRSLEPSQTSRELVETLLSKNSKLKVTAKRTRDGHDLEFRLVIAGVDNAPHYNCPLDQLSNVFSLIGV